MVVLAMLLSLLAAGRAQATDFVEGFVQRGNDGLRLYLEGKLSPKVGWWGWGLATPTWGEAYAGPLVNPTGWSSVGVAVGRESGGMRYGAFAWVGKGRYSSYFCAEDGHTGYWDVWMTDVKVRKNLTVGLHQQTFLGWGPRVAYTRGAVTVWTSWLMESGRKPTPILSVRVAK